MAGQTAVRAREKSAIDVEISGVDHEAEHQITHVIPSVQLTGTRAEKLRKLDTLIVYLEQLRRGLAGEALAPRGGFEGPSRYALAPEWPWFLAGMVVSAILVLLALFLMRV